MDEQEHRRATRKRVLKGALIAFNNRTSTMSCAVRDLSETGARLRVTQGQAVPSRFDLIIESERLDVSCKVAWRKGEEVGVTFETPLTGARILQRDGTPTDGKSAAAPSLLRKPRK